MKTLWQADIRAAILARLDALDATRTAQWGTMTVAEMTAHLVETCKICFGEKPVAVIPGRMPTPEVRAIIIFGEAPWPQGKAVAPPEYLADAVDPALLATYRQQAAAYVSRFAQPAETHTFGRHAYMDSLTPEEWGGLMYKHFDHHLRQFGC
jgi:hypothetical protein